MPKHIAKWNPARDVWEDTRGGTSLFCGHSDVYSGTFPASGMTLNGVAYELQTWEHRTGDTGYSSSQNDDDLELFQTPSVADVTGGHERRGGARSNELLLNGQVRTLLPTPSANIGDNGGSQHPDKRRAGGHQPSIQDVAEYKLLPTPQAHDAQQGKTPEQVAAMRARGHGVSNLNEVVENGTDWGPFAAAIARWEQVLGRPAPSPTVPDGRGGKHRLSPAFVEWMMGLPEGWVTDVPIVEFDSQGKQLAYDLAKAKKEGKLTRNEQLKALGNGVVPQQCSAALADMLAAFESHRLNAA